MTKVTNRLFGPEHGFTLIELIVVISILGVLTAIVVPAVTSHLGRSQEEAYKSDVKLIQKLVDQYFLDPNNLKLKGKRQYPILGAAKVSGALYAGDPNSDAEVIDGGIAGNPLGGTTGGAPIWADDGSAVRESIEDVLNDEDSSSGEVGWHVKEVVVSGVTYYVDTRDFIMDFDLMLNTGGGGLLREPPKSASQDSCSISACTGSYIYFVDRVGNVKTLLAGLPTPDASGFQEGVFP